MAASEFVGYIYILVGRPFKEATSKTQVHLGIQNDFKDFQANIVPLEPKPGKLEDIHSALIEIRSRQDQMVSLGEIMVLAGKLIFLLMSCFKKMATGGVQPFFQ